MSPEMAIHVSPIRTLKDNYVWAIINTEHQSALIVDPGEAKPVIDFLKDQQLTLAGILITHHHWDHTDGILELNQPFSAPVIGPISESIPARTLGVTENDTVSIPFFPAIKVMAIPGHTLGHVAYYFSSMLFCGDTLFAAGCGRIFEGTPEQMYKSIQKIAALPNNTKIYCAHEYTLSNLAFAKTVEPANQQIIERIEKVKQLLQRNQPSIPSTLIEEKETNPFLRCDIQQVIDYAEKNTSVPLNSATDVFSSIRKAKDQFKIS